jgi:host factor-I protein
MLNQSSCKRISNYYEPAGRKASGMNNIRDMQHDGKNPFKSANLQEIFLNSCRKNENTVRIELLKGEPKEGKIIGFDTQSVILSNDQTQCIIYKSAITAVIPTESVQYIFNEILKKDYSHNNADDFLHIGAEKACHHA